MNTEGQFERTVTYGQSKGFPAWDGNGKEYAAGYIVERDGILYEALITHKSQPGTPPEIYPQGWKEV